MSFDQLLQEIQDLVPAAQRRQQVLDQMSDKFNSGFNCRDCSGYCCTFEYNSMQISPLEAFDVFIFLKKSSRLDEKLIQELKACVKHYRLDYEISTGKGTSLRRTYTCPFFKPGPKGCTIDPSSKPYGCLAFNPLKQGVSEPGFCSSDQKLLEDRESSQQSEVTANEILREQLKLDWDKKPLPLALLNLIKALE